MAFEKYKITIEAAEATANHLCREFLENETYTIIDCDEDGNSFEVNVAYEIDSLDSSDYNFAAECLGYSDFKLLCIAIRNGSFEG